MARWQQFPEALVLVLYLATGALLVAILSRAEAVLVPVALAVLLTFVLTPVVRTFERGRIPRVVAVAVTMLLTLGVLGGFGWVLTRQLDDLAAGMPEYSAVIRKKTADLRPSREGTITRLQKTADQISKGLSGDESRGGDGPGAADRNVQRVVVVPGAHSIEWAAAIAPGLSALASTGIVLVLAMVMLVKREDLRDRMIRLVGRGRVTLTTRTLDEAGHRISRFLLTQSAINAGFGTAVTLGLLWIGVPYAVLWGVAAALLRFVPYVGSLIAMAMPIALAFVQFDGWTATLETLGLFLFLEGTTANLIEPLLVGRHTGVSSLALLVTALFWTWLWGPLGLVLSTPLTVCLAVIGKHVRSLEFLAVLLGDEDPLEPEVGFYQRLLARDEDEASDILEGQLQRAPREQVFDQVIVPALLLAAHDSARDDISAEDHRFVLQATADIVENLAAPADAPAEEPGTGENGARRNILGVPSRRDGDEVALALLARVVDPAICRLVPLSAAALASEVVLAVEREHPDAVYVVALPPGGLSHVRYLCKRLRARFPALRLFVLRPGIETDVASMARRLGDVGADHVVTSLTEARAETERLAPSAPQGVAVVVSDAAPASRESGVA